MNIIAQNTTNVQASETISCFMKQFRVGQLLKALRLRTSTWVTR